MNQLLIAISAALGAGVVLLGALGVVASRRAGRRADARVDEVVRTLETRMDELARELAGAMERAEEEGRRSRFLREIAGTIDLDDVLARTLEAASALPGADAALVRLDAQPGKPVVATLGLSADEAERQAIAGPPDGHEARAIELGYRYGPELADEELVHGGLAVPLVVEGSRLGHLTVFTRAAGRRFTDDDVRRLEEIAERAAPAIENARRFREVRLLADLDALTGLHNRRYFHETLAREVARAHRYGRGLALVVFDLDDFKAINDRIGHLGGDAVLAEAAARVREVVRSADLACRVGGDEFAVIVPEAGLEEARQLVQRIERAVSSRPIGDAGRVRLSAGIAELRPEDDPISLFERADQRLYAAKAAGRAPGPGVSAAEAP
ncbi:MAG: sensor domain-containing diguanylate cyclase [Thermoleophilia bacterium]|nr:sensor domain-containing diguanylate cyclase [Thermoleophilia bacterium]